jgi:predicted dienelactone hydrolase
MRNRIGILCILTGMVATAVDAIPDLDGQAAVRTPPSSSTQAGQPQEPVFKLPDPSGTFGIGRVSYEWVDAGRPDPYSADSNAHRALMVYLWYPTERRAGGEAAPYLPSAKQMDADPNVRPQMVEEYGVLWPLVVSGEIKSHAIAGAAVAKSPKQFPVVLLSHGLGGTGLEYTSLIEELVSLGYVVAAIEHTYTASAVAFPDGRVVPAHHDPMPEGLSQDQRWQRMIASVAVEISRGADDVMFVLNQLDELNKSMPQGFPLRGRLDLNHVAAVGHSAGGAFAVRACELDARIRACVSLDGEMPPIAAFPEYPDGKRLQQPVLLLEVDQTGKRKPFSEAQFADFQEKEEEQLEQCPKWSYHVLLNAPGLFHGSFSDYGLRVANGDATKTEQALRNLHLTQSFTRAFLDKYLKGEKAPLLDEPSQSSEATVKKHPH